MTEPPPTAGSEPNSQAEHRFAGDVVAALGDLLFPGGVNGSITQSILKEASVDGITVSVTEDEGRRLLVITFELTDRRTPGRKGRDSWAQPLPLSAAMLEEGAGASWASTIRVELQEDLCARQNSPTEWDEPEPRG